MVQHSAYRESSHRLNVASSHIFNGLAISLAYSLKEEGGGYCSNEDYRLPAFAAPRGREGGSQHPVGTQRTSTTSDLVAVELVQAPYTT
jgi:hypothetical protein